MDEIANQADLSFRRLRELIKLAEEEESETGPALSVVRYTPRPPKPLTPRALLWRLWQLQFMYPPAAKLSPEVKMFWLGAVLEISAAGDGFSLEYGTPYSDRADFCAMHDVTEDVLALLFRRGLLEDLEDGIGLPAKLGLCPKEREFRPPEMDVARTNVRGQGEMLHVVPGGRGEGNITAANGGNILAKTEYSRRSEGNITAANGGNIDREEGNIPAVDLARATATTTFERDSSFQGSSSGSGSPRASAGADESGELNRRDGGNIPAAYGGNIGKDADSVGASVVVDLGEELARLAKLSGPVGPDELKAVEGWLNSGLTREMMVGVVTRVMGRRKSPPAQSVLTYFDGAMQDAATKLGSATRSAAPSQAPAAPAAPVSAEDRAIAELIRPATEAWRRDHAHFPFPPNLATFKAAAARGDGDLAQHWIGVFSAWMDAGRPDGAKPPDFTSLQTQRATFQESLAGAEEELTGSVRRQVGD